MTRMFDASGAETTIANAVALGHWNSTIENVLAHAAAAPDTLAATLIADPAFALGHAAKGLMIMTLARRELIETSRNELSLARKLAATHPVTPREQAYISALAFWMAGHPEGAVLALEDAIALDANDILAAKMVHAIRFMMGDLKGLLISARRHLVLYGEANTHSGYLMGCLAFAHEENGDYRQAEILGRRALALTPRDAWGRHSVAHVLEMTGRAREGAAFLVEARKSWSHCNNFGFHLSWHEALFHLELGNHAAALDLYDHDIRAQKTNDYRDIANASSLLQRLEIAGVCVGQRWDELAELGAGRIEDRCLVFADLHYALALAGAGRSDDADDMIDQLRHHQAEGYDGALARSLGVPVAMAIRAFRSGQYHEAARLLMDARPALTSIGGSHAQRDVFEQLLIESAIRSGNKGLAEMLLNQRLIARGGQNHFASRRLADLSSTTQKPAARIAGALAAMSPSPALH